MSSAMPLAITIDPSTGTAPYEQIEHQVRSLVERGVLCPGDKLPTVRGLAAALGLAPNTVARSYRELEQSGVIETRGRGGSFVTGDEVLRDAKQAAASYVAKTQALGVAPADALRLVRELLGCDGDT